MFFRRLLILCFSQLSLGSYHFAMAKEDVKVVELPLPNNGCWFSGEFTQQKQLKGLPTPLKSSGYFFHHCDRGVIWHVAVPTTETRVFTQAGDAYAITEQAVKKMNARQAKILGELLNGLIGGDQQQINQQFKVSQLDSEQPSSDEYLLVPKKRKLKRALKQIKLTLPNEPEASIKIAMQDRRQQWTIIKAKQVPTTEANAEQHCGAALNATACELLFEPVPLSLPLEEPDSATAKEQAKQ